MQNEQSKPEHETMICICRQDGQIRAEGRRLEVQQLLAVADPSMLCETLIMSLAFDFGADVEVYPDQWFAIDVGAPGFASEKPSPTSSPDTPSEAPRRRSGPRARSSACS